VASADYIRGMLTAIQFTVFVSLLLSKNIKAEMYKTAIFLQFLMGLKLYLPQ
jgi:hypothetical protein